MHQVLKKYWLSVLLVALIITFTLLAHSGFVHWLAILHVDDAWPEWIRRVPFSMLVAGPFLNLPVDVIVALLMFGWILFYSERRTPRRYIVALLVAGNILGSLLPRLIRLSHLRWLEFSSDISTRHTLANRDTGISSAALCLLGFEAVRTGQKKLWILIIIELAILTATDPASITAHLPPLLLGMTLGHFSSKNNR